MKIKVRTTKEAVALIAEGKAKSIADFRYEFTEPTPLSDIFYLISIGAEVSVNA